MRRLTQLALGAGSRSRATSSNSATKAESTERPTFAEEGWARAPSSSAALFRNYAKSAPVEDEAALDAENWGAEASGLYAAEPNAAQAAEDEALYTPEEEQETPFDDPTEKAVFGVDGEEEVADGEELQRYYYSVGGNEEDGLNLEYGEESPAGEGEAYQEVELAEGAEEEEENGEEEEENGEEEAELYPEETEGDFSNEEGALKPFTPDQIARRVQVRTVEGKGRCLYTRRARAPGEIILIEEPLLVAVPSLNPPLWELLKKLHSEEAFELPPVWHLAALCSIATLSEESLSACLEKWVPDPDQEASSDVFRVLEFIEGDVEPKLYERLLQVWRYNSFGHHTESDGLVLYDKISMMAHSCRASASWHYGEGDAFVLRARVDLEAGAEITISYIGDGELFKSTNVRRDKVRGWLFVCHCLRCDAPVDDCRGFRCPACGTGTTFFQEKLDEDENQETFASPCSVCGVVASPETVEEYLKFESAYFERLADTNKDDLADAEAVYEQATRVFTQHWILYELDTILFEGYRALPDYEAALNHQKNRVLYASQVLPQASYSLAWLHEELGDLLAAHIETASSASSSLLRRCCRSYEDAYNLMYILCGPEHDYTRAAAQKLEKTMHLKAEAEGEAAPDHEG